MFVSSISAAHGHSDTTPIIVPILNSWVLASFLPAEERPLQTSRRLPAAAKSGGGWVTSLHSSPLQSPPAALVPLSSQVISRRRDVREKSELEQYQRLVGTKMPPGDRIVMTTTDRSSWLRAAAFVSAAYSFAPWFARRPGLKQCKAKAEFTRRQYAAKLMALLMYSMYLITGALTWAES